MKIRFEVRTTRANGRRKIFRIADDAVICSFERDATDEDIQSWIDFLHWEKSKLRELNDQRSWNRPRLEWSASIREHKRDTEEPDIDPYCWRGPGEKDIPIDTSEKPRGHRQTEYESDY